MEAADRTCLIEMKKYSVIERSLAKGICPVQGRFEINDGEWDWVENICTAVWDRLGI